MLTQKLFCAYQTTLVFQCGKSSTSILYNPNLFNIKFKLNSYLTLSP